MAQWIKICAVGEIPQPGKVVELDANGTGVCLANVNGELSALDNLCPHRQGPLGQGWIEGEAVICPWHSWAFHAKTGISEFPANERVSVYPIKMKDDSVLVELPDSIPVSV